MKKKYFCQHSKSMFPDFFVNVTLLKMDVITDSFKVYKILGMLQ